MGSTGLMTEQGLAYLVWRDGAGAVWPAKGGRERPATPGSRWKTIRKFIADRSE